MARCDLRAMCLPALAGAAIWILATLGMAAVAAETPTPPAKPQDSADPFGELDTPNDPAVAPKADAPRREARPPTEPLRPRSKKQIEEALDSPTQTGFVDTPLSDVADFIMDYHGIEVQIDKEAFAAAATDPTVTLNVRGVSLRTALNLLSRRMNLAWFIEDDVLLFTTPAELLSRRTTEVYDVTDLVICRDDQDRLWHDLDPLVAAARAAAGNGPIANETVTGATFGSTAVLMVTQSPPGHDRVAALLAKIRKLVAQRGPQGEAPRRNRPER
jgi:hypothetical protein